ncbi:MAG: hypothetical protein GY787_26035, partial [Alteromonadales bacterium]|nr:hypothetical protein [Alteromonadales bacterium]
QLVCYSEDMIPIKNTLPNEDVDISVQFTSPYLPGSCRTDWKMVDRFGNVFFPNLHGVYSIVHIVSESSRTTKKLSKSQQTL